MDFTYHNKNFEIFLLLMGKFYYNKTCWSKNYQIWISEVFSLKEKEKKAGI